MTGEDAIANFQDAIGRLSAAELHIITMYLVDRLPIAADDEAAAMSLNNALAELASDEGLA